MRNVAAILLLASLLAPITGQAISFTLTHEYADPNSAPENDYYGTVVLYQGDTVLISGDTYDPNGAVLKFGLSNPALIQTIYNPSTAATFTGFGGAMTSIGSNVAIGSPSERFLNSSGALRPVGQVYLFDGNGNLLRALAHPDPDNGGSFGASVADLGGNVLVGSPNDRRLILDEFGSEYFVQTGRVYLVDPATGGAIRYFDCPGLYPDRPFFCGAAVTVYNGDVVVGDSSRHKVPLLDSNTGNLIRTFENPDLNNPTSRFGKPIAVIGQTILIGDPNATVQDSSGTAVAQAGRAYLFDAETGALLRTFEDPTPRAGALFGGEVIGYGDDVLISAAFKDAVDATGTVSGRSIGVAYLFDSATGNVLWTFQNPSPDPLPDGRDRFGFSMAVLGTKILISADSSGQDAGTVYLYTGQSSLYAFGGVKPPIRSDGSSIFKLGHPIPVKFTLSDIHTGRPVGTAVATLDVAKISNDVVGTYEEAESATHHDDGNQFVYEGRGKYIFKLSTRHMTRGNYRLRITLDDSQSFTVDISLR